ncbi:MAG: hypothetical protein ACI8W7_000937, partial [Gammaproteobacteria bacterium]
MPQRRSADAILFHLIFVEFDAETGSIWHFEEA